MYLYLPTEKHTGQFGVHRSWDGSLYADHHSSVIYWTLDEDGRICPLGVDMMVPAIKLAPSVVASLRDAGQVSGHIETLVAMYKNHHPLAHGLCRRISIPCGTVAEAPTGW